MLNIDLVCTNFDMGLLNFALYLMLTFRMSKRLSKYLVKSVIIENPKPKCLTGHYIQTS